MNCIMICNLSMKLNEDIMTNYIVKFMSEMKEKQFFYITRSWFMFQALQLARQLMAQEDDEDNDDKAEKSTT